jgi:hypothetical protein
LLNDTRLFHAGAAASVAALEGLLAEAGHEVVQAVSVLKDPVGTPQQQLVVCNGEGTLHHGNGRRLLDYMAEAKRSGSLVWLLNSVWDRMPREAAVVAAGFDRVDLRDEASYAQLKSAIPEGSPVRLGWSCDASTHPIVLRTPERSLSEAESLRGRVVVGDFYGFQGFPDNWHCPVDDARRQLGLQETEVGWLGLRGSPWTSLIDSLQGARLYLTGQYHGAVLAHLACVPVLVLPGTSHKSLVFGSSCMPNWRALLDRARGWLAGNREWDPQPDMERYLFLRTTRQLRLT